MNTQWRKSVVKLAGFVLVCVLAAFALFAVFGTYRFSEQNRYQAEFSDVSGLAVRDIVRVGGVEVGQVKKISVNDGSVAMVEFSADRTLPLTEGTRAVIRWANPIGDRYLALLDGPGDTKTLNPGATIPMARTEPALDLDTLLGGFRPLFRALDPEQVNTLSSALISAFQGEGTTIGSFLNQAAVVTNTLADRDELIGQVIGNLNVVLGSLGDQSKQFGKAVDSLAQLVKGLEARKSDVSNAVAYSDAAAASVADMLAQARAPFDKTVKETDRTAALIVSDHDYFDDFLNTLPDAYQQLAHLGARGDFLTEYLCTLYLKLNGKGGQPVYVKMFQQTTGRCEPR